MNTSDPPFSSPPTGGLDWLYQTQLYGIKLGLDNVHRLLGALSLPAPGMKFLHVAGTNGKGSTCAFLHALLKASGSRVGLFTSPHLIRFNERIRDHERAISDAEIEAGLAKLRALVADWDPHPTFFELTLALALDWFRERGVEWAVLETGLGGRLDATNALTPEVCALTRIGLDHREQLGDTLGQIAAEKAGIFKPGVPAISVPQVLEARRVIEQAARVQGAPLTWVEAPLESIELGLAGPHQGWNAALAVEILREAGVRLPALLIEAGLKAVEWPARFQRLDDDRLILDGAHNGDAATALAAAWKGAFDDAMAVVVVGGSTGKNLVEVLQPLVPLAARWVLTRFDSPRSVPLAELRAAVQQVDPQAVMEEAETLGQALELAQGGPERVLVTGSLFLAGELLALREGATVRSTQQ